MTVQDRAAGFGVIGTWAAWFASHIADINLWLQFFLLVGGLISTGYAIRHYRNKNKSWHRDYTDTGSFRAYRQEDSE